MSVVLGYDESNGAERALRVAIEAALAFNEPLVLVYGAAAPGGSGEEYQSHHQALRQQARKALHHAVESATVAGVQPTVEIIDDKPYNALIDAGVRHQARVIVVGSWGESPIRGALLGSTPHKLLHLSKIPVLCVPTE
nr:universal stress protein [Streptomyces chartreusis]